LCGEERPTAFIFNRYRSIIELWDLIPFSGVKHLIGWDISPDSFSLLLLSLTSSAQTLSYGGNWIWSYKGLLPQGFLSVLGPGARKPDL